MNKTRTHPFLCVLMVVMCFVCFSAAVSADTGYYQSGNSSGTSSPMDNITISKEEVEVTEKQEESELTPEGNLTLVDDILQSDSVSSVSNDVQNKQFITVQTKSGNYFYVVIDRSGDTENVYFLSLVDEADILALIEDSGTTETGSCTCEDKCADGKVDTACSVCKTDMTKCSGKEVVAETTEPVEETEEKGGFGGLLVLLLVLAAVGGGLAFYFLKFRKDKEQSHTNDPDDYDYDDDDECEFEPYDEAAESDDVNS